MIDLTQQFDKPGDGWSWMRENSDRTTEGMFFNPRHPEAVYLLEADDLILRQLPNGKYQWFPVEAALVGVEYKQARKDHPDIKSLSIPLQFEFSKDGLFKAGAYFSWSALGMGWGQMSFHYDPATGDIVFDTERIGPVTTRKIMHQFVDFLVDNAYSRDWEDMARERMEAERERIEGLEHDSEDN